MKLIFLGPASSTPFKNRYVSSIVICAINECILLDCGEATQIRLQEAGIDVLKIRYVVITHLHGDHFYGIYPLIDSYVLRLRSQRIKGKSLDIYAPSDLCDELSKTIKEESIRCIEIAKVINEGNNVQSSEFSLRFVPMQHGDIEAYGVILTVRSRGKEIKLFYSGDGICSERCLEVLRVERPCIVIHEASFLDYKDDIEKAREKFHATVADAAKTALEAGAKILILTHFSNRYDENTLQDFISRARRIFNGDILLAHDLMLIPLNRIHC